MKQKIHYAWLIATIVTLLLFCTLGMNSASFSVFLPYMVAAGLSHTQVSSIITVRFFASTFAMCAADDLAARLKPVKCAVLSLILGACGYVLYAIGMMGDASVVPCWIGAAMSGASFSIGGMVLSSILIRAWFESRRALALSVCTAGSGIAAFVVPLVMTPFVEYHSLSSGLLLAACFFIAELLLVVLFVRNSPAEKGTTPYRNGKTERQPAPLVQERKGLGKVGAAVLIFAFMLLGGVTNIATSQLSNLYTLCGYDSQTVSFLLSLFGVSMIAGKFLYGACADKIGGQKSNYIFYSIHLLGMVLSCFANSGNFPIALLSVLLNGLGLVVGTVSLTVAAEELISKTYFAKALKLFFVFNCIGSLCFSIVPGVIADSTGSYVPAFLIGVVMLAITEATVQSVYHCARAQSGGKKHDSNIY